METGELTGFIGLASHNFKTDCTSAMHIVGLLKKPARERDLTTENAKNALILGLINRI